MRIARVLHEGRPVRGVVEGDVLRVLDTPLDDPGARLLAPVAPRTVVGMAHNTGPEDRRKPPQAFLKPAGTVIGPGAPIPVPGGIGRVDAEAELAAVIGRPARHLRPTEALPAVLGYTVGNDVTARDLQRSDPLWTAAKGQDGFTPLGPWIETDLDPDDAVVALSRNGEVLRPGSTRDLARDLTEVLVYLTSFLTLAPGDVVLLGAPGEYTPIRAGDVVEAHVSGIGTLTNPVSRAPSGQLPGKAAA